ncbi:hypothetical protein B7494_g1627 [Chlorociboria aeruginascens]|nr:hypothetical protein B7494_g1627 [Chlorociboria aeruginascens]
MHVGTRKLSNGTCYDYFMGYRTIGKIRKTLWAVDDDGTHPDHIVVVDHIDWDAEISAGWASHCDVEGNWLKGKKQAGEKLRRAHLEKFYDNLEAEKKEEAEAKKQSEEEARAKTLNAAEERRKARMNWLANSDDGTEEDRAFAEAVAGNNDDEERDDDEEFDNVDV